MLRKVWLWVNMVDTYGIVVQTTIILAKRMVSPCGIDLCWVTDNETTASLCRDITLHVSHIASE